MKWGHPWQFRILVSLTCAVAVWAIWCASRTAAQEAAVSDYPRTTSSLDCNISSAPAHQLQDGAGVLAGQPLTPVPQDGILVLRNGQVLAGKITRAGDFYYVGLPEGEIRLRAADVEFACRDLEEGYQRKRAMMQVGDVHQHLRLAQWCQRQGLLERAAAELADARRADPTHPMIEVVERRLKMAMEPQQSETQPAVPAQPPLSFEQLDRLVRGLPAGSVETFTQTIQPLLLNNCTVGGCHGPQSPTKLHLMRIPLGQPAGRRLTQRNLSEVLQFVDKEHPGASKLLTVPVQPHGAAKAAIFSDHQASLYRRLVLWTYEVTNHRLPEMQMPAGVSEEKLAEGSRETGGFEFPTATLSTSSTTAYAKVAPAVGQDRREPTAPGGPKSAIPSSPTHLPQGQPGLVKRGAATQAFIPADPFDPEIFNRQFHRGDEMYNPQDGVKP